jgi:hypothetical protein
MNMDIANVKHAQQIKCVTIFDIVARQCPTNKKKFEFFLLYLNND